MTEKGVPRWKNRMREALALNRSRFRKAIGRRIRNIFGIRYLERV